MKNAIVIGGTSGIGKGLVEKLLVQGWNVGVTGRRVELLRELEGNFESNILTLAHDVTDLETIEMNLGAFFNEFESIDLVVVSSGVSELNEELLVEIENKVIQTNVNGVVNVYQFVFSYFKKQGFGHLVGISSIASLRGSRICPAYSASKAFQANYLEALRCVVKHQKLNITITDVQPGFVNTAAAKGEGLFWVASVFKSVEQIYKAILKKKRKTYVSKRWVLIVIVMKIAPNWLLEKL